ncbi:MAG: GAF domain-containing protein [Thermostichus sp. BF3_bins_97]
MIAASSQEPHSPSAADLLAQNRYLNALYQTSLALLERRQMPELLQMIVQQAAEWLGAPKGFIFRVDEADPQVMRFEVGLNVSPALVGQHIRPGEGLAGRVWESGSPLQVEDYLTWPDRLGIDSDSRAMVGVPLRWRSQVVGVLGLAHTQLGRLFSPLDIQWLEQFAQLVALALDNAQLHRDAQWELQERRWAEAALAEEQQRLISTLASIGDGVIGTDGAGRITLVNPAAERLTGWSAAEALGSPLSQVLRLVDQANRQPHPDLVQAVLRQGEVLGLAAATVLIDKTGAERFLSASAAPITNTLGKISGVVVTFRDISRHRRTELALRQSIEREHLLASVALRIHRSFDLGQILSTAATGVRRLLQADRVLIYQFQPNGEAWAIEESVGLNWPRVLGRVIQPAWFGDLMQDYRQGKVRAVDNLQQVSDLTPSLQHYLQECQVCAQLVVPLFPGQQLWGILVAHQCAQPRQWQPEEVTLMEQLATQVEIALQQASLYRQVRDLNDQLERKVRIRTTQLNKQLNALKLQEQLLDTVETGVVVTDHLGQITYWNHFASSLYGLAGAVILGELITDGIPFQPEQAEAVLQAIQQGERWSGEVELEQVFVSAVSEVALTDWKNSEDTDSLPFEPEGQGSARTILIEHTPLRDEMGQLQGSIGISVDISQRKQAERELKQRMQELQQLNRLKDDFLSTVSHELRTPMANMKMSIHLLRLVLEDLQVASSPHWAKAERYLGILQQECARETELINDLLDLQRLESGVQRLQWEWISLRQWLPSVLKPFEMRTQQRQQSLSLTLDPAVHQICTDCSSLGRILAELLNNACKYSPPSAQIHLQVSPAPPAASPLGSDSPLLTPAVSFAVTNTGVEIPVDQQERIFDKFYRIPAGDPWRQGGTGLGLALIRQMVLRLKGAIQVSSGNNQTCFRVDLPIAPPQQQLVTEP